MIRLIILLAFFLTTACGEYENLELKNVLNKRADSLYYAQKDSLEKLGDSLCDLNFPKYFDLAFDSLKNEQLDKIEKLMDK